MSTKRLVVVPVHLGSHWAVATINVPDHEIVYYDSSLEVLPRSFEVRELSRRCALAFRRMCGSVRRGDAASVPPLPRRDACVRLCVSVWRRGFKTNCEFGPPIGPLMAAAVAAQVNTVLGGACRRHLAESPPSVLGAMQRCRLILFVLHVCDSAQVGHPCSGSGSCARADQWPRLRRVHAAVHL